MSFTVVDIQPTPNPNAMKFVLDGLIGERPASFFDADSARGNPTASRLFALPGVASVLLLNNFVTVNKTPEARWAAIKPRVKKILEVP